MAIDYVKILQAAASICQLFNLLHQNGGTPLINITAPIDLHIQFIIVPGIGSLLDSWLLLQGIISALLP